MPKEEIAICCDSHCDSPNPVLSYPSPTLPCSVISYPRTLGRTVNGARDMEGNSCPCPSLPRPPAALSRAWQLESWGAMNPSVGSNTGPGVCVKTRKPIRAENERQGRCEVRKETARQALAVAQLPLGLCGAPPGCPGPLGSR